MRSTIAIFTLLSVSTGCMTSLLDTRVLKQFALEQRIVSQFSEALQEDNEAALRRSVSTRFEFKALRSETAYKDLEIVSLPKTELTVVETEEVDATTRRVIVTDKSDDKYQIQLVRDAEKKRWTVDDITSRQQKKGTRGAKSCTEVMDLLLTLREFLETWQSGERDAVLSALSTELRQTLEPLPEAWLQQLVGRVTQEYELAMARRPEAQMNDNDAVVKLPAKNGFLLVKVDRVDDRWLVSDVEVHNRRLEDHPGSIRRQANAMLAVTTFLSGYNDKNLKQLESASTPDFFDGALRYADLSLISMPSPEHAPDDFEIRAFAGQLTVMIPDKSSMIRLDLTESADADDQALRKIAADARFVVREVTLYDRQTMQQRNLSSAFTGPARALLFMTALEEKDLSMLRATSAQEFSKGTWDRIQPALCSQLPMTGVPSGELVLLDSRVRGRDTELSFQAASGQMLSILLTDENGSLKVKDVQFPNQTAEIISLRSQLELAVPVLEYATAWANGDLESVRKNSSTEFNRLVWSNVNGLPQGFVRLPDMLRSPLQAFRITNKTASVTLKPDGGVTASIRLVSDNDYWMVDEISLRQSSGQHVDLRAALRGEIAQRFLNGPAGSIQQVSHQSTDSQIPQPTGVVFAHAEAARPRRGNLTMPSQRPAPSRPQSFALDVTPKTTTPPSAMTVQSGDDGVLYFGPSAAERRSNAAVSSTQKTLSAPATVPAAHAVQSAEMGVTADSVEQPAVTMEEIDGVTYFRPVKSSTGLSSSSPAASPAAAAAQPASGERSFVATPPLNNNPDQVAAGQRPITEQGTADRSSRTVPATAHYAMDTARSATPPSGDAVPQQAGASIRPAANPIDISSH